MFSKFYHIQTERNRQLETEEELDKRLYKLKCKSTVSKYLFSMRRLNREMTKYISLIPFYEVPSQCIKNIEHIDRIQTELMKSNNLCETLRKGFD